MKTRVLSGIVIAVILIGAGCLMFTPVFDFLFCALAGAACYEVMKVAGVTFRPLHITAIVFAVLFPALIIYVPQLWAIALGAFVILLTFVILTVANNQKIRFTDLTVAVYATLVIPAAFASICLVADLYKLFPQVDKYESFFMTFTAIAAALLNDVFAYFVGSAIGKHKMTPVLSPHKSWEGAVGGVLIDTGVMLLFLLLFVKVFAKKAFFLPVWAYAILVLCTAVLSIFGDLIASFIKRNYDVKDYSNLIPGHGGIMDRFDSVLLASPTVLAVSVVILKLLG